jgi:hypothetical protein
MIRRKKKQHPQIISMANLYLLHKDLFFTLVLPVIFPELLTSGQLYYSDVMILFNLYIILYYTSQQPDGFLPLRAFKPSSSESANRGRSIIQVSSILRILLKPQLKRR